MTVHNLIYQRLRESGYAAEDAKAIIWIAKAAASCAPAKKWWTRELSTMEGEEMAIEKLSENVRKLAARYTIAFLFHKLDLSPELRGLCELERLMIEDKVALITGAEAPR